MASRLALPYYAPDLPSTLPTEAEIENASDLREYCFKGRRVVTIRDHYIVKYGSDVNLLEGDNMLFVRDSTNIRVPRVYAIHEEFIEAMVEKYVRDGGPIFRAEYYRQCLPKILCRCDSLFTHGNLQRKNVMVEKDQGGSEWKVTILDWEFSGWYPSYWEYSMAFCALGKWDNDWYLHLRRVLEPADSEAAWVKLIRLEMFE
ncbi:hypothetical protein KC315_g7744 [Hortaea werneckii]|nr:hypothetical protein KC342_g15871 [Hortaea werneckii]KAI7062484.1 hypothetical protein KC339_g16552 [Hortaea werneckii]KAI7214728.1 hypothetical protein KC365_g13827 [Hortaea werneckii]KAI7310065.1 hypothetical protein KC340_g10589 [Hortaea werneckii]KAI7325844.1 hypothetical protein KC315_g7744 [Hortaea werneckii]